MNATLLDKYPQVAVGSCLGVASAGSVNCTKMETSINSTQRVCWAVSRIEYYIIETMLALIDAVGQFISVGVGCQSTVSSTRLESLSATYDSMRICKMDTPAAIGERDQIFPLVHDFPVGNELLIMPAAIYGMVSWSLAGTMTTGAAAYFRMWYKALELGQQDWFDLVQMRFPIGGV